MSPDLPEQPRWLIANAILRRPGGHAIADGDGFLAVEPDRSVVFMVGRPDLVTVTKARFATVTNGAGASPLVFVSADDIDHARACLPDWRAETVLLHELPEALHTVDDSHGLELLDPDTKIDHVPDGLRPILRTALATGPVAAAIVDGVPVSFCYPFWRSERYWDVSVDTLEGHRGRGLGERCVRFMASRLPGMRPILGPRESEPRILEFCRHVGFVPVDRIYVLIDPDAPGH
ncbi:MAG: hypothetical protein AAGD38_16365 [Acidobacteriota bacterium]